MKDLQTIHEHLDCCGQVTLDDVKKIQSGGYDLVICARHDKEEENQPQSADIAKALEKENIAFLYLPFSNVASEPEAAELFCSVCEKEAATKKTLAYCRTGNRILQALYSKT